jgi:hypothetical protein
MTKLEALGLLTAATALFVQNELADGPDRQQRNAAYLRYALAAGHRPRLAELLAAPSSPPAPALRRQPATRRTATATSSRGSSAASSPHHRTPGAQSAHIWTPEAVIGSGLPTAR